MNWIDFNILCIGEKKPEVYKNSIYSIEVMNRRPNKSCKCYKNYWDVVNHINGIWYELWTTNKEYDFLIDSTWALGSANNLFGYQLFIDEKNRKILYDILNFYLENSPIKKIIVLFRHQGYESGYIENDLPINSFIDKLINKEIYGNIAYIVSK